MTDLSILVVLLIRNCIIKQFKLASHKQIVLKSLKYASAIAKFISKKICKIDLL